jgi:hypothetical protein
MFFSRSTILIDVIELLLIIPLNISVLFVKTVFIAFIFSPPYKVISDISCNVILKLIESFVAFP